MTIAISLTLCDGAPSTCVPLPVSFNVRFTLTIFSPSGQLFAVAWAAQVDVYSAAESTKAAVASFGASDRVSSLCWSADGVVAVGTERGRVLWFSVPGQCLLRAAERRASRVKDVALLDAHRLVGVSSAGEVLVWDNASGALLVSMALDDRLTCLSTAPAASAPVSVDESSADEEEGAEADPLDTKEKKKKRAAHRPPPAQSGTAGKKAKKKAHKHTQ